LLTVDPEFQALIPRLTEDERRSLEESIVADGCRDPLVTWGDVIVDGHNRYEICTRRDVSYIAVPIDFADRLDAMIWIRRNQVSRRNLTDDQRSMNGAELAKLQAEKSRRQRATTAVQAREIKAGRAEPILANDVIPEIADSKPKQRIRAEVAKASGTSERKIQQAQMVMNAAPALAAQVASGEMPLAAAVREVKRAAIVEKLESVESVQAKELAGEYDVIVIDPPWPMQKIERDVRPNQSEFDYPVMSEFELAAMKMPAADDCHMWLWTTHKFLPMALRLLDSWQFKYVCTFVWHKPGGFQPIGLPQYNCEFAIYARKGSPKFVDTKAFPVCFDAARGAHSEKPGEFYEVVRRVTAGRRIDIFNRRQIDGFDVWGNQASA